MELEPLLRLMVEKGGSDLFITTGVAPAIKIHGKIMAIDSTRLSPEAAREMVFGAMSEQQQRDFAATQEANFALSARGIGRFRVSAFYQRNQVGMVVRRIETKIPTIDYINLPEII